VVIKDDTLERHIRSNMGLRKRREILYEGYPQKLKEIIPGIISQYEKTMKVKVDEFGIKKMKTRWGTCN
jgi:hypothetical protein